MIKYFFYSAMIFFFILISCTSTQETISQSNQPEIMDMKGQFEQFGSDSAIFTLNAKRLKIVDGEYLPSSEEFVVKVYNDKMSEVYNSSKDKNFFMVISEVEPKTINGIKTYNYAWNMKNNINKGLEPGKYNAQLIIPAKPKNYICNIEFEIK